MNKFGSSIKEQRKRLGLKQLEFSKLARISKEYLVDIENRGKIPSMSKLFSIVKIASYPRSIGSQIGKLDSQLKWSDVNGRLAIKLLLATAGIEPHDLGIEGSSSIRDDLAKQSEGEWSEIWIISDVLAESRSKMAAESTARSIRDHRTMYRFFIPYSSSRIGWKPALRQIEAALGSQGRNLLEQCVRIYFLSDCSFSCRMRIADPESGSPQGEYNIGGTADEETSLIPAPNELTSATAKLLGQMYPLADVGQPIDDPNLGSIERAWPEVEEAFES